jgi:sugar phosphate isomerase/epimerase
VHEGSKQITPSQVAADLEAAIALCRDTHRLNLSGYSLHITATGEEHYRQFAACCRLAKATKVVALTVPSAELGTPFNEEVEHLRKLVSIAAVDGILVAMRNQVGRLTQDVDTVTVMCDHVKGLGITLDPSHLMAGPSRNKGYDSLLKYTYNVHLRDSKREELQVRVGQGEVEYSRLVTMLRKQKYNRALTVYMHELPDVDHNVEMRKMRLLLETLL